jgi:hypothetical protein
LGGYRARHHLTDTEPSNQPGEFSRNKTRADYEAAVFRGLRHFASKAIKLWLLCPEVDGAEDVVQRRVALVPKVARARDSALYFPTNATQLIS